MSGEPAANPLLEKIRARIRAEGPLPLQTYMALCAGDPEHGYYTSREPFGRTGDFITAPEISQLFGEIVGAWLAEAWERSGRPDKVRLIELGPGRGTLMADILRTLELAPDLNAALKVDLVETSERLRARQRETLVGDRQRITWHDRLDTVPAGPALIVANEFFDALPIRQFVSTGKDWRERSIGLSGETLAFVPGEATLARDRVPPHAAGAAPGAILELAPAAEAVATAIAERIARHGAAAIIIDYGASRPGLGDTLQAVSAHAYADPLEAPGRRDLTAHVDLSALAGAARRAGARPLGPITQAEFLLGLGILERAGRLGAGKPASVQEGIRADVDRLVGAEAMGTLFKVLAFSKNDVDLPPFC